MTRVDPGGGASVGIDPQLLQNMINTMNSSTGSALSLVNYYVGQMSRCGLDTSGLTKAIQDLTWAQDQVPMLNRRQSIAQAMEQQNPGLTVVSAGAGTLDFATNSAAQAAGKADAGKALQALQDHSNTDFIVSQLSQYANDPAYLAAYFQALGPQGLASLGLQVIGYQQSGQTSQYQAWAAAVGNAFATASYQMPYQQSWLGKLQLPNDLSANPAAPQLALIQPFLEQGVYSATWLNPLGQYALQHAYIQGQQPGMEPPVQLDGIWTALARNPAVDAQFYSQNFTSSNGNPKGGISAIMTSPYLGSITDSAFAGMVQAATIPPANATSTGPFAANAQLTVRYFGDSPDLHTSGPLRQVLGNVAMFYYSDMLASVGAAAPGIGAGQNGAAATNIPGLQVTASSPEWASFLDEVMRDRTAAAQFLTFYSTWRTQFHDNLSPWANEQFRLMDNFVVHQYQATGQQAGTSPSAISKIVSAAGSSFITGLPFGPEAGVGALLLSSVKDGFKSGVEGQISGAFGGDGAKLSNPVPPDAIQQITLANSNWERIVRDWYNSLGGQPAQHVTYGGQPVHGDPQYYINQFGGSNANFLDGNGKIQPLNEIQAHSAQLAAYNAWLQSGAVAEGLVPGISPPQRLMTTFSSQTFGPGN